MHIAKVPMMRMNDNIFNFRTHLVKRLVSNLSDAKSIHLYILRKL